MTSDTANGTGPGQVPLHIAQACQEMAIILDGKALEPALVRVPTSERVVGVLPSLDIGQGQPAEKPPQRSLGRPLGDSAKTHFFREIPRIQLPAQTFLCQVCR